MSNILLLLALIPSVIDLVKKIELPGNGADKSAAVGELVRAALDFVPPELTGSLGAQRVLGYVDRVVGIIVAFYNKTGHFAKP